MTNFTPHDPETQVRMLLKSIELQTECEDCGRFSFEVFLIVGCPYCKSPLIPDLRLVVSAVRPNEDQAGRQPVPQSL